MKGRQLIVGFVANAALIVFTALTLYPVLLVLKTALSTTSLGLSGSPIPDEVSRYARWQRRRLSMKPGLTGLWQVSGRADIGDFDHWIRLDLAYIDTWSLWLDLTILLRTIPAVLSGRGAG